MSAAVAKSAKFAAESKNEPQSTRETVESVVVAFILAFLFRAFVAEAFVIPTGSMAPTLMGAHKDIFCEHCGQQYQASASQEFDPNTGAPLPVKTVASTCANCRGVNDYDFVSNRNHASFSGDRILVSKFDYVLSDPDRWDVFVFKWPLGARMNYIKRLVGLPGEQLLISEGDVFTRKSDDEPYTIARKPPHKIRAMRQVVSDTSHQPADLIAQGWPSLWQPWNASFSGRADPNSNWTVSNNAEQWSAELTASEAADWVRYYHKFVDLETWQAVESGGSLPAIAPYSSRLITDYVAYNSSYSINASDAFELRQSTVSKWLPGLLGGGRASWRPVEEVTEDVTALQVVEQNGARLSDGNGEFNDAYHWVGDLDTEYEVEVLSEAGTLLLDLVEFGVRFQCSIDVATGQATLQALDAGQALNVFAGAGSATAQTAIRGLGSYQVELANFDDSIVLWVDGKVVEFDRATEFDSREFRNGTARRPHWTEADPLDAAPAGIGGMNLAMKVNRAQVFRDIYYIAVQGNPYSDFDLIRDFGGLVASVPDAMVRNGLGTSAQVIDAVYSNPQWWSSTDLFSYRGYSEFTLDQGQYFPMGDNSAASSDARAWDGHNYVEEKFLLGKALLVFWPHTWNTPVPFTPNVKRMGLIR